ncbi:putative Microtubule associated protein [Seiridium cardinale]
MGASNEQPKTGFARILEKIHKPLGFTKPYNFVLFFFLVGSLMGFTLARLSYFDFYGVLCRPDGDPTATNNATPGECYYLLKNPYKIGMILHLASILPAAFLACFQFVPVIRHKVLILHRVNGYSIITLSVLSVAGALMIARHSFGGGLDAQSAIGFLAILFLFANFMAYVNIKRLQIEQHRAWMLRAWVWAGSAITTRFILFAGANIVSRIGGFFTAFPCSKIAWILGDQETTIAWYPECSSYFSEGDETKYVAVLGSVWGNLAESAAAYDMSYGAAHWLALNLHVLGVELYLRLTTAEHERLRNYSYKRQLEAGLADPGSAGLTADRIGDVEKWVPKTPNKEKNEKRQSAADSTESVERMEEEVPGYKYVNVYRESPYRPERVRAPRTHSSGSSRS